MAPDKARGYVQGVIKDAFLLIAGVGLAALSWPLLAHGHLQIGGDGAVSTGGMALFLGFGLIWFAIADWRNAHRRPQARKRGRHKKRAQARGRPQATWLC